MNGSEGCRGSIALRDLLEAYSGARLCTSCMALVTAPVIVELTDSLALSNVFRAPFDRSVRSERSAIDRSLLRTIPVPPVPNSPAPAPAPLVESPFFPEELTDAASFSQNPFGFFLPDCATGEPMGDAKSSSIEVELGCGIFELFFFVIYNKKEIWLLIIIAKQ